MMKIKVMNVRSRYKDIVLGRLLTASYKGTGLNRVLDRLITQEMCTSSRIGNDTIMIHTESQLFSQSRIVIGRVTSKTRWFDNREVKLVILLLVGTAHNIDNQTLIKQVEQFYNADYLAKLVNSESSNELQLKL